jgi:excinuclease UvrABC nuclease subunit
MRRFDLKSGADFLAQVPSAPGVYRFLDADGVVV